MNFSAEHNNWLAVGEMIRLIKKPISSYVDQIVKDFHETLCLDFDKNIKCTDTKCKKVTPSCGLCTSCFKNWLGKLQMSHTKGNNPSWSQNCDPSKWYDDHWEVAKFFMSALGNNRSTVKDAESTDLSSLLNVLEWMENKAFLGRTRVKVDLVRQLRSEVRNNWAHAPNQELSDQQKEDYFNTAAAFLQDLKNKFLDKTKEIEDTEKSIDYMKVNGIKNVVKSEIENLLLTFNTLSQFKEELVLAQKDSLTDEKAKEDIAKQIEEVKNAMESGLKRMKDFEELRQNINQEFESFGKQLRSFGGRISEDISDIKHNIQLVSTDIKKMTGLMERNTDNGQKLRSCLPEKFQNFTARGKEIEHLMKFIQDENTGIMSLQGGPGFGKSALAVEVSHRTSDDNNIVVVFTDLSNASSIDEVTRRICRDVGINPEEDPRSSLSLMLKKLKTKVVFVLDDIDNLVDGDVRSEFDKFVYSLRKHSNQNLKIITTSRNSYTIEDLPFQEINIDEMDEKSSLALLRNSVSRDHSDEFLQRLAHLCGNVPLAMCIAVSLVNNSNDPNKILKHLQDKPMRALSNSKTNQFVYKAFNTSYIHLTDEESDALLRLTVFEGDFSENAAKAVLEGDDLKQENLLTDLVNRSLLKKLTADRYTIHVLIKSFLRQQKGGVEKRAKAERLMVAYYLDLCNESTIQSYSKDRFMQNREILKREAHNIEKVLTICTKKQNDYEVLLNSEIYKKSCRFFYNIVKTFISETVLANFLQSCAKLANVRKEWPNKINFDCMLADQEGRKSFWKSDEYFIKMDDIKDEFEEHQEDMTEDLALQAYLFYQLGRCSLNQSKVLKVHGDSGSTQMMTLLGKAREHLEKSLEHREKYLESFPDSSFAKADVILSLMQLGNLWKKIATTQYQKDHEESKKSIQEAKKFYEKAIDLANNNLGKHEISATCYKILGDLLLLSWENASVRENYQTATRIREELSLDTSEEYVLLLSNMGRCLMFMKKYAKALEMLEKARDIAEKLADDDCPTVGKVKVYKTLARTYVYSATPEKAKEFAEKALKINKEMNNTIIGRHEVNILQKIIDNSSSME